MSTEHLNNVNSSNESLTDGVIDVSLPPTEWFDEMFGPSIFVLSDLEKNGNESAGSSRKNKVIETKKVKTEIVDLSDDDELHQPVNLTNESCDFNQRETNDSVSNRDLEITTIENEIIPLASTSETNTFESTNTDIIAELKKIVLTKTRLNLLSESSTASFHKAVIGCFVRVKLPRVAEQFKNLLFFDQIENVFEPMSFQHFWFNRRYRLANFGDFEIENIFDEDVNDSNIRRWVSYVEAKDGTLPTIEFIKQKEADLLFAMQQIKENPIPLTKIQISANKIKIRKEHLEQIMISIDALRNLAKLDFERFRSTVTGCFVFIQAIRNDKPATCQYHICPIKNCIRSGKDYKIRNIAIVDYQIVLPYYGKYNLNWLRDDLSVVTEEGFKLWIEDMIFWNEEIPNLEQIRTKAAILQLSLNEAETLLTYKEKAETISNEMEKNLPVKTARDLDGCLLTHQRLKKLSILFNQKELLNTLDKTMNGCFVRLKTGPKKFRVDQVKRVEMVEVKEESTDDTTNEEKKEEIVLHLNSFGTITINNLFKTASQFKIEEQEFNEWLRIMHRHFDELLPTKGFLEKKQIEIENLLKIASDKEERDERQRQINRSNNATRVNRSSADTSRKLKNIAHNQREMSSEQIVHRPRSAGPSVRRQQWSGHNAYQTYSSRPVRTTPGVLPGWTSSGITSTDLYNRGSELPESLTHYQQNDDNILLRNRNDHRQFFPFNNNSLLGKRPMGLDDMRQEMMDLWKKKLHDTDLRQREHQLSSMINDEHISNFRIPFVRGGTIINDRSFSPLNELRSTSNYYSSSPIQKSLPQFDSRGLSTSGSFGIDNIPSNYQSKNSARLLNNFRDEQLFSNASTSADVRTMNELLNFYDENISTFASKKSRPLSPIAPPVQRFF